MSIKFTFQDVYIGDEKNWGMSFDESTNNPTNLSNRTLYFTAKVDKSDLDSEAIIRKSFLLPEDSYTLAGTFVFQLTSAETTTDPLGKPIQEGTYHCDFRLSQPYQPTVIYQTIEGIIEIEQPVTNLQ